MAADPGRCAFFYGTLMAPQVLHRVCHGCSDLNNPILATHSLKTRPAVLHDYRRHRVKHADYPAVLPHDGSSVRGTFVSGLTDADIWRLDIFEGDEYRRANVRVRLLERIGDEAGVGNVEGDEVDAETYVWISPAHRLEQAEWDFAQFQRDKMRFWVGAEGAGEYAGRPSIIGQWADMSSHPKLTGDIAEVDEAVAAADTNDGTGGRGFNGHITNALDEQQKKGDVMRNAV